LELVIRVRIHPLRGFICVARNAVLIEKSIAIEKVPIEPGVIQGQFIASALKSRLKPPEGGRIERQILVRCI
jgi:hypothetical protein